MPCKRWSCASCSQVRKQEWIERLYQAIRQQGLTELHCWSGDSDTWGKVYKALQRRGARFLRVSLGGDRSRVFVVCTVPLAGGLVLTPAAALDMLAEALRSVPLTKGRPVTCTRGWLPVGRRERRWRYAGEIPASDQHFERTLAAEHQEGTLRGKILEPGAAAAWHFAADMPEEARARVRHHLFGNTLPVNAEPPPCNDVESPNQHMKVGRA
jgi:hypothetical protein